MEKENIVKEDYKTSYARFLALALSSDTIILDQKLKEMFEHQVIDMFCEPDMYTDLFLFKKFFLSSSDISDDIKRDLLLSIWENDEYERVIDTLEWSIINTIPNSEKFIIPTDKVSMYGYSLEDLETMYQDKQTARIISDEINFCREMQRIRPKSKNLVLEKKEN